MEMPDVQEKYYSVDVHGDYSSEINIYERIEHKGKPAIRFVVEFDGGDYKLANITLDALNGLTRAPQWQPIESCPTDGTVVLLAWKNSMKKFVANNEHIPDWCFEARSLCCIGSGGARSYHAEATHWQPLPVPPEVV